jgi:hypothetical protein
MNKRLLVLIVALLILSVGVALYAQTPPTCYAASFGLEVRPEAGLILDDQGFIVANIENEMRQALARQTQMTGECFVGELGMVVNTEPRVFAVFQSSLEDYGVLRIMTEAQYYPEPLPTNSVGWIHSQELREP